MKVELPNLVMQLGNLLHTPPTTIELIPDDGFEWFSKGSDDMDSHMVHHPFLFVEGNLGVPQKILHKAYMAAMHSTVRSKHLMYDSTGKDGVLNSSMKNWSAVLLLANPAHQMALNVRKRLAQAGIIEPHHELRLIAALLTLYNCSKQSILWHHRRWLFCRVYPSIDGRSSLIQSGSSPETSVSNNARDTLKHLVISVEDLRHEFSIVSQACETYPRNYYAWIHRYLCLEVLVELARLPSSKQSLYRAVLTDEVSYMRQWIELHVSDYTAVQYLCNLQVIVQHSHMDCPDDVKQSTNHLDNTLIRVERTDLTSLLLREGSLRIHAESLVDSYPNHESLWLYLRGALSTGTGVSLEGSPALVLALRFFPLDSSDDTSRILVRPLSATDAEVTYRHACRFLAWLTGREGIPYADYTAVRRIVLADMGDRELPQLLSCKR
ncbi:hypothetical protein AcW1_003519 [Taiwanofungus camphoratus]|nr:hypothetical protein AcV5_002016 [Antrodia cinnamomea]KAI0941703.1 hypothetical protein AcW1_003519 [Antrodia cinnamomea]